MELTAERGWAVTKGCPGRRVREQTSELPLASIFPLPLSLNNPRVSLTPLARA